jgi:hypothetical protein
MVLMETSLYPSQTLAGQEIRDSASSEGLTALQINGSILKMSISLFG